MTNLKCYILLFFQLLLLSCSGHSANWDLEYWQFINIPNWSCGPYSLYTTGEIRLRDDLSQIYRYRISENFAYQPFPFLALEAHYGLIYVIPEKAKHFIRENRLELEVNTFKTLQKGVDINWRNRMEFVRRQGQSKTIYIFRHKFMTVFSLENYGRLTALRVHDEVFYDFNISKFTQNRFFPIDMVFAINQRSTISAFFMIRNYFSGGQNQWYRSVVLGSELVF
jgi:hypothetical protein